MHYISGPAGLCALIVQNYNNGSLASRATYYLQTDYQGSIIAAYNSNGTLYKRFAYDPWGRRRAGDNWTNYQTTTETLITRGYCGHEHLDDFGTINMNGRIYDPRLGRFLSPDPYVQAPYNSQNYNRYSYCLNNPLKYTDPTGEKWWHWALGIGEILTGGLVSGTAITTGLAAYLSPNSNQGYEMQKMISPIAIKLPTLSLGSIQNGLGFDVSIGLPKSHGASYRFNFGATYYFSSYCDYGGWETRTGGEYTFFSFFNYSATEFKSGETSQVTHLFTFGGPFFNLKYENDMKIDFFEKIPGVPHGGYGDRYRTAAVQINMGPLSLGLNMCTGDYMAGENGYDDETKEYKAGTDNNGNFFNPDKYRAGVLSFGIGSFRIGRNSENIRDYIQNQLIHSRMAKPRYFKKLDIAPSWFWYFGSGSGNTLW